MKNLFDLRFVIGSFFSVIGMILVLFSQFAGEFSTRATCINRCCGLVFFLFGAFMIWISVKKKEREKVKM